MTYNDFHYALVLAEQLYDIDMQEDTFEELGMIAWNQIGNKRCKIYRYSTCMDNCQTSLELPCNADILEAVTTDFEDFQHVSNIHHESIPGSFSTEQYIEARKVFTDPLYISGKFVDYERVGDTLYFKRPYRRINILYKGIILDDTGLPQLTNKEALAIATYCAYITKFKEGLRTNNNTIIQMANMLEQKWRVQCDQARVPEEVTQNEWDNILDAKSSWDRKIYKKSYKPIR